jgi:hypothetical protein
MNVAKPLEENEGIFTDSIALVSIEENPPMLRIHRAHCTVGS